MIFNEKHIYLKSHLDSFSVLPFACVHRESAECHKSLWRTFLERTRDSNIFPVGLGDNNDFCRSRYRAGLVTVRPDNSSVQAIDSLAQRLADDWSNEWMLHGGAPANILGFVQGNHHWVFQNSDPVQELVSGETNDQYIAKTLGAPWLQELGVVTLVVHFEDLPNFTDRYVLYLSHGTKTGGSSLSADLGNMERKIEPMMEADAYITAHTHRKLSYFLPKMIPHGTGFLEKPHLLVKAGAFLRGFVHGKTTYAAEAGYRPLDLGWVEIKIGYSVRDGKINRNVSTLTQSEYHLAEGITVPGSIPVTVKKRGRANGFHG